MSSLQQLLLHGRKHLILCERVTFTFVLQKVFYEYLYFIFPDADGGPAVFVLGSTLGGVFIGLLALLLIFVLYLRQRKNRGFEPLIKADFTNRKYTEEA